MSQKVLNVGNCPYDHEQLEQLISDAFDAEVVCAADAEETLAALRAGRFDLVLINRKLYANQSDGVELIERIKADETLKSLPIMLLSNYPDAQHRAIASGAEPGFGKAELATEETRDQLAQFLERSASKS